MIPTMVQRQIPKPKASLMSNIRPSPPPKSPALAMFATNSPSRIPIRMANAEMRSPERCNSQSPTNSQLREPDERTLSPLEIEALKAEKRAAWRHARLKSLEQDALQAQAMIQSMNQMADGLIEDTKNERVVFPRIAIKSSPGALTVREREKVVDEKVIQRTEEISCPITGQPQLRTVEYVEKVIETEVETCQEKIISLELQDPEKEVPILMASDEDTSSIVTIRPNPDKLFLRPDNEDSDRMDSNSAGQKHSNRRIGLNSFGQGDQNDELDGQTLSTSSLSSDIIDFVAPLQTIVEVVNPIIAGDGCPNKIAIGRSSDCAYPSFDDYTCSQTSGHSFSSHDEDDDDDGGSYRGRELSLNDKMKNVLQELLKNERVKLNLSRSLIEEDDSSDPDDEDDDSEVVQCQNRDEDDTDSIQCRNQMKPNGNFHIDGIRTDSNENFKGLQTKDFTRSAVSETDDRCLLGSADDYSSFVDGCRVYQNPNTEISFDDGSNTTITTTTSTTTITKDYTAVPAAINETGTLMGKLMSQLHANDKDESSGVVKPQFQHHKNKFNDNSRDDDVDDDEQDAFEQPDNDMVEDDDAEDESTITKTIITTETTTFDSTTPGDDNDSTTTTTVTTTTNTTTGQAVKPTANSQQTTTTKKKKRKPKNKKK